MKKDIFVYTYDWGVKYVMTGTAGIKGVLPPEYIHAGAALPSDAVLIAKAEVEFDIPSMDELVRQALKAYSEKETAIRANFEEQLQELAKQRQEFLAITFDALGVGTIPMAPKPPTEPETQDVCVISDKLEQYFFVNTPLPTTPAWIAGWEFWADDCRGSPDGELFPARYEEVSMPVPEAEPEICPTCSGSGEGMHEGTTCSSCGGKGVERTAKDGDDEIY